MRDVATAAGVSVQTVSNLVNGRTNQMTPETQSRIQAVMDNLGYHPNSAARGLRSARSHTFGFLILDDSARFLADPMTDLFMSGLGDVLRDQGYALLIQASRQENPIERLLLPLLEGRVDAAVVFLSGPAAVRARYIQQLRKLTAPVLLLQEHELGEADIPVIAADDFGGARDLCRHLLERGHRAIGYLTADHRWSAIEARHRGYVAAHEAAGLRPNPEHTVWRGRFDAISASEAAGALLDIEARPTALMCGNDLIALGVLKAARDRGLRVPDDLAVTGFDDFDFAAAVSPPLTTVAIPGYEMGRLAARVLIESGNGEHLQAQHRFPTQLRVRESA